MCDREKLRQWARDGLNRRQFGTMAGAATLAACTPLGADAQNGDRQQTVSPGGFPAWTEQPVAIKTADGTMDGWFVTPTSGPAPAVLLWPDIAGLRESKKAMARRMADRGYAVLVANQYYRDAKAPIWEDFADFAGNGGWPRAREMRGKLDAEAIMRDARAVAEWLATRREVDQDRGIGSQGYCMGGPFAIWSVAAHEHYHAAASFHGGGLVRDGEMSPHRMLREDAHYLVAIAQDDDADAPGDKTALRAAADNSGATASVEVYAGDHGWCVPDSPAFAEQAADKAFNDLLALYENAL